METAGRTNFQFLIGDVSEYLKAGKGFALSVAVIDRAADRADIFGIVGIQAHDAVLTIQITIRQVADFGDLEAVGKSRSGRAISTLTARREGYSNCDKSTEFN